mgnify:CR=1 FL=1
MKKFDYREELRLIGMPAGMGLCLASIETVLDAMTTSTTSHEEILYITTEMTLDEVKEQMLEEAVKLVSGINISDAECSGLTLADKIKIDMVQQWFIRHTNLPTLVSFSHELMPTDLMSILSINQIFLLWTEFDIQMNLMKYCKRYVIGGVQDI